MRFAAVLAHLRVGEVTMEDWGFMQTRVLAHLPDEERARFKNALFLFQTNDQVRERNLHTLESLHMPVARIVAKYQDIREEEGAKVDDDDAGGLPHELLICVGARVLTGNLSNANIEGHVYKERLAADGTVQWESRNDQGIALRR